MPLSIIMGGKLDIYLDIASLYSYVAFAYLQQHGDEIRAHGIDIEYHPVLIGGINSLSGNQPPWTLPAKRIYLGQHDSPRSLARVGLPPDTKMPPDFMRRANTLLPLRALIYVKHHYSVEVFTAALARLFQAFWNEHMDLTNAQILGGAIAGATTLKGDKCFSETEIKDKIIGKGTVDAAIKKELKDRTQEAVDKGAFGAPWIIATNAEGKKEPFFGSDRFHFVYEFLSIPYEDVKVLPPASKGAKL